MADEYLNRVEQALADGCQNDTGKPPSAARWRLPLAVLAAPPVGLYLAFLPVFLVLLAKGRIAGHTTAGLLTEVGVTVIVAPLALALVACLGAYPMMIVFGLPFHLLARAVGLRQGRWYAFAGGCIGSLVGLLFNGPNPFELLVYGMVPGISVALVAWAIAVRPVAVPWRPSPEPGQAAAGSAAADRTAGEAVSGEETHD